MNQRSLKAVIRAVGTIAGLFGILLLLSAVGFVIPNLAGKGVADPVTMLVAAMFVIPGVYLTWVLYLVWRRFSPKAVLHCCGAVGFFVLGIPSAWFDRFDHRFGEIGSIYTAVAFLLWLLFVIAGYRALSRYLVRRLFNSEVPAGSPVN